MNHKFNSKESECLAERAGEEDVSSTHARSGTPNKGVACYACAVDQNSNSSGHFSGKR